MLTSVRMRTRANANTEYGVRRARGGGSPPRIESIRSTSHRILAGQDAISNASCESAGSASCPRPHDRQNTLSETPLEELDAADFSLLHQYTISTAYTLAAVPGLQTFLRVNLPRLAFSHRFLLHGLLAIAALHLYRFKKDVGEVSFYMTKALHHHGVALRKATSLMKELDTESGPALYLFTSLCFIFTLGLGPNRGDFLLFGESGISDWFAQFRGMKRLLEASPEILHNDDLSPWFEVAIRSLAHTSSGIDHLSELREQILQVAPPAAELKTYLTALDQLSERFDVATGNSKAPRIFPQQVFVGSINSKMILSAFCRGKSPLHWLFFRTFAFYSTDLGRIGGFVGGRNICFWRFTLP